MGATVEYGLSFPECYGGFSGGFFFSSRRRHTRFKCDWSSDVCSSDLLMRLGAAKAVAGRAFPFVHLQVPGEDQQLTRETFRFRVDKKKLQEAEWHDGHYLLRSNLTAGDPSVLWTRYVQLTQIESVFRSLKR